VPANTARRLTFLEMSLRDITFLPVAPHLLRPIVFTAHQVLPLERRPCCCAPKRGSKFTPSLAKRLRL
jgi:hypothetical protein